MSERGVTSLVCSWRLLGSPVPAAPGEWIDVRDDDPQAAGYGAHAWPES